ncbi:tyrosinase family protein [uncultured Algibacter sp.]|uniref:tyrosinase family protein n=1 Tax=uncultured Algibacter sp. TaxID=298659 RepID=UPI0026074C74|nr:tyrosinase family protein [uncultured Algibacter sp.]
MYRIKIILLILIVSCANVDAQSIRKNYNEMTQTEKDALVDAFVSLKDGIVADLASFHGNNFTEIHFNLPYPQPGNHLDVFFSWHRYQMWTMEHAMQALNPKISLPFWNWTLSVDRSKSGPLWEDGSGNPQFMGRFDDPTDLNWGLGRSSNASTSLLPTTAQVNSVQNIVYTDRASFQNYSNSVERGRVHTGGHIWTGGIMASGTSPADPIFYLHHTMVDKLWQDWIVANNVTSADLLYERPDLINWNVDPNSIVDSKVLGVFYADEDNDLAVLHDYSVTNNDLPEEVFYYQFTIEAENNFIVPNGKVAKIESVNEVILKPGFHAESGSQFIAKIDLDNNINTARSTSRKKQSRFVAQEYLWNFRIVENVYLDQDINEDVKLILDPDKKDALGLEFKEPCISCRIDVVDVKGNTVQSIQQNINSITNLDLKSLLPGTYFLNIRNSNDLILSKEILKLK